MHIELKLIPTGLDSTMLITKLNFQEFCTGKIYINTFQNKHFVFPKN